jgi:hypothetical protein
MRIRYGEIATSGWEAVEAAGDAKLPSPVGFGSAPDGTTGNKRAA